MISIHQGQWGTRFSGKAKSPFEQELDKVVLAPEIVKRLEAIAQQHGLDVTTVKNVYRQERAHINLMSQRLNKSPLSDSQLIEEFEKRDWKQTIGPRS
jgi:hypothetical protein